MYKKGNVMKAKILYVCMFATVAAQGMVRNATQELEDALNKNIGGYPEYDYEAIGYAIDAGANVNAVHFPTITYKTLHDFLIGFVPTMIISWPDENTSWLREHPKMQETLKTLVTSMNQAEINRNLFYCCRVTRGSDGKTGIQNRIDAVIFAKILLAAGAQANAILDGKTALEYAQDSDNTELVALLEGPAKSWSLCNLL